MPKSRGRRTPAKKSSRTKNRLPAPPERTGRSRYDMGRVRSPVDQIAGLLLSGLAPPDLMVELLPPMLWLEHVTGHPANLCVSSCVSLHFAYAALGIAAHPRAVDLVVDDQRADTRVMYGRRSPSWSGSVFHGHCVLWLPGSRRFIDPTVEQYPEVRRYQLGPICGRLAASIATPAQQARMAAGELIPGTALNVQRQDLMLRYTTVDREFDDVVWAGPSIRDNLAQIERAGRNLAVQALALLSQPEVIDRARHAPHPRVRALLDLLIGAEINDDDHELRFVLRDDPTQTPRRLDELNHPRL